MWSAEELDNIPVHFILCTERTGSSLLTSMLNMHPSFLVSSEEPFALYFQNRYKKIRTWNEKEIANYVEDFFKLFEKNVALYFDYKDRFHESLIAHKKCLNYERLIKLTYLHFYDGDIKDKSCVRVILDKQMKYIFHKNEVLSLFPNAQFILLTRDVLSNIEAKTRRGIDFFAHPYYQSQIWKMTYHAALTFPRLQQLAFEDLIQEPAKHLEYLNAHFGMEYSENQHNYQEGFKQLIEKRNPELSDSFRASLFEFHSGILGQNQKKGIKAKLPLIQERVILKKTHVLRSQLGYLTADNSSSISIWEAIKWFCYGFLAWIFRPGLWRVYRRIPMGLKILLRKKKADHKP